MTSCFHVFHQACAKGWIDSSIKTCPNCKALCYQHQAGKDFQTIWKIFLKALEIHTDVVEEVLINSDHIAGQCTICTDTHPSIPLFFDPKNKQLFHETCTPPTDAHLLSVDDIVNIVKKCAEKDLALKALLTPTPPSLYERLQRDYPEALPYAAAVGAVAAFALSVFALQQRFFR